MSDGIPPNEPATKKPPKRPKLERSVKLPTPPPDPWDHDSPRPYPKTPRPPSEAFEERTERSSSNVSERDREMFDYIESLHKSVYSSRAGSGFAPAIVTEDAFDHLEKLYKLMEQMLELREQNVKLHRRIRDLEHLNNLEKFSLNPDAAEDEYPDLEKDAEFAQAVWDSILQDPKNKELLKYKTFRTSLTRRHRSGSATDKQLSEAAGSFERDDRDKDKDRPDATDKRSRVSKWTKVKAAFKWEKASNVGDTKSQDSGVHVPINYEIARYLRVPSTGEDIVHSPGDSGAGVSTPGSISSASSNDDIRTGRPPCDDFRSSDDENPHQYIPHSKDYRHKSHGHKYHRTPWAKMKDMINTRNSLRKKHRLSAASDDIQIDVEFCSDNEDVFDAEDAGIKSTTISLSPSPNVYSNSSVSPCESEIPPDVFERYQRALAEDSTSDSDVRPSRWTRVRRAFLSRDRPKSDQLHSVKTKTDDGNVEDEIRRNYKKLQKKLSLEFQEKINEWERLKQNSPGASSSPCGYADDPRDSFYLKKLEELQKMKKRSPTGAHRCAQMTSEFDLPADFKKKLQEWEKMKKTSGGGGPRKKLREITKWKSLGGPRSSDHSPVFEYPALTDDFRKKLEEWRQIKASGGPSAYADHKKLKDKTPSPKLSRKNSSPKQSKKVKDQSKELHWFEKELGKIEKEKQRLERERQKFIEREERLSKLRKSMLGAAPKREILIHTPSGFHRFEGISRKFTQKLYEWEKSQGIAPEASTFALLSASNYAPPDLAANSKNKDKSAFSASTLPRSKSADSIAISALNLTCPLLSGHHHPSSLSLNDMDELAADSKTSPVRYLVGGGGRYVIDDVDDEEEEEEDNVDGRPDPYEPEAVLVEVEDYEEETAEPLHVSCVERQQLPVYQRQECKPLCESETIVVPKVRRSESARAQISYDLIEGAVKLLTELQVTEDEIRCLVEDERLLEDKSRKTLKFLNELQNQSLKKLAQCLLKLQEANRDVAKGVTHSHLDGVLDNVQDVSAQMLRLCDQMSDVISARSADSRPHIFDEIKLVRRKIGELRRHLSYVCAATDQATPPVKRPANSKLAVGKTFSGESTGSDRERRFIKMEGSTNICASQGAVKKRIRYRQKTATASKSAFDTDDEDNVETEAVPKSVRQHKKLTRTRSVSEGGPPPQFDPALTAADPLAGSDSAVTLFVKTTRKLFTPLVETALAKSSTEPDLPSGVFGGAENTAPDAEEGREVGRIEAIAQKTEAITSLPPLPPSPVPQRKVYKEVSPSIKLIMAKYNQSVEQSGGLKSGGSSGSNSPAWRSPVAERKVVKEQTEKYQEELNKLSPSLGDRRSVQKSSSASLVASAKQVTIPARKSSLNSPAQRNNLTVDIALANRAEEEAKDSPEVRMKKLQRAKEEFLRAPVSAPTYLGEEALQFPERNRLSQISVESGSSYEQGALMKSASAGMINIDADVYNRINPEYRAEGYVSLPRTTTTAKKTRDANRSAFSAIASKFRKVKMRRGKERDKARSSEGECADKQAVATLCRQSLLVDISNEAAEQLNSGSSNNGEARRGSDVSKSNSWIRLFKR